ncbi:MAG: hypothetical protein AB7D08_04145 [Bacteroidales bacterium]
MALNSVLKNNLLLLLLLLFTSANLLSQEIKIDVKDKPLNIVLSKLGVEISFDNTALSGYRVTLDKVFDSPSKAIDSLLVGKPLQSSKIGNVFVVYPNPDTPDFKLAAYEQIITGVLMDSRTGEALPYGNILTPDGYVASDESGTFSFKSNLNERIPVLISYLGYDKLDTVLFGQGNVLKLTSKQDSIPGVMISAVRYSMVMQAGLKSGENRINHFIARYLPGSSDNSVFTLLRMMPGVRASNEPSVDLLVWGGPSKVTLDGFTLFGMRGFNDNISFVNPYMVKEITLLKGGYDVSEGGHAGAVAKINGYSGNNQKAVFKANIGTLTANLYGSIPVSKMGSLSMAYRQTFYHLYSSELLNPFNSNRPSSAGKGAPHIPPGQSKQEVVVYPKYAFRDMNVKFTYGKNTYSRFYVSLYGADDKFDFGLVPDDQTEVDASQHSKQLAGATGYERFWSNGSKTRFTMSFSALEDWDENIKLSPSGRREPEISIFDNNIREVDGKIQHSMLLGGYNTFETGLNVVGYSANDTYADSSSLVGSIFFSDKFTKGGFNANAGLRADIHGGAVGILPRFSISQKISYFHITASWGIYRQYLNRVPLLIEDARLAFPWKLTKPLVSIHSIAGIAYERDGLLLSAEGFNKRYDNSNEIVNGNVINTRVNLYGIDFYAKKIVGSLSMFGSYSFQKVVFPVDNTSHEIKAGGVYGAGDFVFSSNYVYGYGFPALFAGSAKEVHGSADGPVSSLGITPYSRLDCAVTYVRKTGAGRLQTGLSIINVLDTPNVKYTFSADSNDLVALYSQAMNFTPMLFFEFIF